MMAGVKQRWSKPIRSTKRTARSRHAVRPCLNVAPRDKRIEVVEDSCLL
jgi:hypothetical protein